MYNKESEQIYAIGGRNSEYQNTKKCEEYDIKDDQWTNIAELNEAKYDMTASITEDKVIYLFGGFSDQNGMKTMIERYNTVTG